MAIHSIEEYFGDIFKQLVETEEVSAVDIIAVQIENSNTIPQMIQVIHLNKDVKISIQSVQEIELLFEKVYNNLQISIRR
jgi:hypothetical protein